MVVEIACDCQFPAVQGGIAAAPHAVRRLDHERDEIAARAGNHDPGRGDLQHHSPSMCARFVPSGAWEVKHKSDVPPQAGYASFAWLGLLLALGFGFAGCV